MLRSSRLVASRRFLSDGSAHLGVLHVYRLSLAERPPGKQLKLLFPSGAPKSDHDSAAQLAMAAERGDPVLVPERALRHILDGGGTQLQLDASAPTPTPSLPLPSTDSAAGEGGSSAAVLASGPGSGSTELALAFAERAVPLADALAGGAADGTQPDWARTVALPHDDSTNHGAPTEAQNAVLAAAVSGDSSALAKALSECPPADLATATLPPSGATPLHLAAASGALRAVRLLLDTGVNVNASATNGSTALHWAAGGGHTEIVRALLSAGASPRARSSTWGSTVRGNDSGQTAAHWAAASGETSTLELLLAEDPHSLLMEDERQLVPATVAARDGHQWLHDALTRLHDERVVCVHVQRDATLQRPLGGPVGAAREGEDEASRKARPAIAHGESAR